MNANPFRALPPVHDILARVAGDHPRAAILTAVREELAGLRLRFRAGEFLDGSADAEAIAARVAERLGREGRPYLRPVINATGVVLHTNLGRAPLAEEAARAAYEAGRGYLNLELDLATGKRSARLAAVRDLLCRLTGAEAAAAVNNNAAATVIALRAVCHGKEVVVSRGQLVEIGGGFRIPEIMAVSGAVLREVGTTNITRPADYERALGPQTGALLRVHPSNFRQTGFTRSVPLAELVALGRKHGLPVLDDIGSGALLDFARFGLPGEPVARDSVAAGADLVLFSGDKLLGGPQAGLLVGRAAWVHKVERDPLMRAFRLDKMTLAALEATLRLHLHEERALSEVPVLRLLAAPLTELRRRAEALAVRLREVEGVEAVRVCDDVAYVGGGSLPDRTLPACVLEVAVLGTSEAELARRLRAGRPPVVGRLRGGRLVLDLRTVFPQQEVELVEAVRHACLKE